MANLNKDDLYELLIIGAGPAGVSAALYAKSRGIRLALIEKNKVGGLIATVSKVSHYSGLIPDETGASFAARLEKQLKDADVKLIHGEVLKLNKNGDIFTVEMKDMTLCAKTVIIACGSEPKSLGLNNKEKFVSHNAFEAKDEVKDKTVLVCGGSDGAAKEAIFLSAYAKEVIMVQDQDKLMMIDEFRQLIENANNIRVILSSKVTDISVLDNKISSVVVHKQNDDTSEVISGNDIKLFAFIGQVPNSNFAIDLVEMDGAFIKSENLLSTVKSLYIAGDCRTKTVRQIATAVADGCEAAIMAAKEIISER